ncbi:MAG: hypothetical protein QXR20_01050, partial [Candidatus Caldarchaeum sp.]
MKSSAIVVFDLDGTLMEFKLDLATARRKIAETAKGYGLEMRERESIQELLEKASQTLSPEQLKTL